MLARLEGGKVQLLRLTAAPDLRQGDALIVEEVDEAVVTLEVGAVEDLLEPLLGGDQRGGTHTTGIVQRQHLLVVLLGKDGLLGQLIAVLSLNDERRGTRSAGALDHLLAPRTDGLPIGEGEGLDLGRAIVQSPSRDLHRVVVGQGPDQRLTTIRALVERITHGLDERQHLGRDATERVVVQLRHRLGVVHHVLQSRQSEEVDGVVVEDLGALADQLLDPTRHLDSVLIHDAPLHEGGVVVAEDHGLGNGTTASTVDHRRTRNLGDRLGRIPVAILVLLAEERSENLIRTPCPARLSQLEPEALLGRAALDVAVVRQTAATHQSGDAHGTIGGSIQPVHHLALVLLHDQLHFQRTGHDEAELLVRATPLGEERLAQRSRGRTALDHLASHGIALVESRLDDVVDISQDLSVIALGHATLIEKVVTSSTTSLAIRHVDGLSPLEHEADRTRQHVVHALGRIETTLLRLERHVDGVLRLCRLQVRHQILKDIGVLVPTAVFGELPLDRMEQREHRDLEQIQHGAVEGQLLLGPEVHRVALQGSVHPVRRIVLGNLVTQQNAVGVDHRDLLRAEDLAIQKLALHDGGIEPHSGVGEVVLDHLTGDALSSRHLGDRVENERHDLSVQAGEKPLPTVGDAHLGGQGRHHLSMSRHDSAFLRVLYPL